MTTTTPPDARNALAEIVAGLDGVTPGPWRPSKFGFQIVSDFPEAAWQSVVELRTKAQTYPSVENEMKSQEAIAFHLARCSPEVFRSIAALVSSQDARIAALEAQVEGMREENAKLKTMLSDCDWYWPEDDTSSDACADGTWQIVENCDVKPGEVFGYSRGGVVETRYYGYLEAADDADSDNQFEADESTREAAEAKISAELQRRAALQSSETTGEK